MELCSRPAIYLGPNYGGDNEDNGDLPQKIPCMYCYISVPNPVTGGTIYVLQQDNICQGCILSPCLFNLYAEYIMGNAGLGETQAGIKTAGKISITSDTQMTSSLWQKVKN